MRIGTGTLSLFAAGVLPLAAVHNSGGIDETTWSQEELEATSDVIRKEIEELRGQSFKRPVQVEIADREGFIDYVKERAESTETPESLAADETVAKLLGLIDGDVDLLEMTMEVLEGQVGGFYDPGQDTFYLMDTFTGDIARVILSHELTHALDDQYYDIDGTLESLGENTDAQLAYHAVVEGSGMVAMMQWTFKKAGEIDMQAIAEAQDLAGGLDDAPPLLWKPLLASYIKGMMFLDSGRRGGDDAYIDTAFTEPPRSTEQVLHPEKYWDPDERDEPRRMEFDVDELPDGWEVLAEDTLGELMLALLTTPLDERGGLDTSNPAATMLVKYTNAAAEGWGGDRLVLLGNGDARAMRLVTCWDTPDDAAEFEAAVRAVLDASDDGLERRLFAEGDDIVVIDVLREADDLHLPSWAVTE